MLQRSHSRMDWRGFDQQQRSLASLLHGSGNSRVRLLVLTRRSIQCVKF